MSTHTPGVVSRRLSLTTSHKIWMLTAGIGALAGVMAWLVVPMQRAPAPFEIPLLLMIGLVYVAEMAVVHLEYGADAHSFSMSELAIVLGLFFASPANLLIAVVVGNVLALTIHRRQPVIKLAFNVAQFALQAAVALLVFHTYLRFGEAMGPWGWAGAVLAVMSALVVSDFFINVVLRITGSKISANEQLVTFGISAVAALLNTAMALVATVVLWLQPVAAWLAAVPPVAVFMAYRAYISQRAEQDRTQVLYEAVKQLHRTPRLHHAMSSAAASVTSMLNAEVCEIYLLDSDDGERVRVTAAGPGDRLIVDGFPDPDARRYWQPVAESGQAMRFDADESDSTVAAPLIDGGGEVLGVVVVRNRLGDVAGFHVRDVTILQTFAAQIAVSISNNRLNHSLAEAHALAQERESLIRAKDDFIASVSHELRTPLTSVLGLSSELAMQSNELNPMERAELLSLIAEQSSELSHLVDDLLVSARSDIGTLYMTSEPVTVADEIRTVLRELGREVPVACDPIQVLGDGLRMRQIIRNLLSNAERYGGDTVRIEVTRAGSNARIAVIDNGTGVPAEMVGTIFEAYGRAHEPGSQPASIGLGLYVARSLARRMGGDLVYRRYGGETRFVFSLALVDSSPDLELIQGGSAEDVA